MKGLIACLLGVGRNVDIQSVGQELEDLPVRGRALGSCSRQWFCSAQARTYVRVRQYSPGCLLM